MSYKNPALHRKETTAYAKKWRHAPGSREKYLAAQRRYTLKCRTVAKKCDVAGCNELGARGRWTYCKKHALKTGNEKIYGRIKSLFFRDTGLGIHGMPREVYLLFAMVHKGLEEINECRRHSK